MPNRDDAPDLALPASTTEEETKQRASELAHRALQEAVESLHRARTARLSAERLDELELMVARARQLVAAAQIHGSAAREAAEQARTTRAESVRTKQRAIERRERGNRGFIAMVTWGRRRARCTECGDEFVVTYHCSTHEPLVDGEVHCPRTGCGAVVTCEVPASAYAFQTRAAGPAQPIRSSKA